jgi:hypothetical protein
LFWYFLEIVMNNFDRIRIKHRKAEHSNNWEVVKETHTAGNWDGPPAEVQVLERGLTRQGAKDRAKQERDKPAPTENPYGSGAGYSF